MKKFTVILASAFLLFSMSTYALAGSTTQGSSCAGNANSMKACATTPQTCSKFGTCTDVNTLLNTLKSWECSSNVADNTQHCKQIIFKIPSGLPSVKDSCKSQGFCSSDTLKKSTCNTTGKAKALLAAETSVPQSSAPATQSADSTTTSTPVATEKTAINCTDSGNSCGEKLCTLNGSCNTKADLSDQSLKNLINCLCETCGVKTNVFRFFSNGCSTAPSCEQSKEPTKTPSDSNTATPTTPDTTAPDTTTPDTTAPDTTAPDTTTPDTTAPDTTTPDTTTPDTTTPDTTAPDNTTTPDTTTPDTTAPETTTPDNSTSNQIDNLSYEQQVAKLVNDHRTANGLSPLTLSAELSNVARVKSQDMHDNHYFSHTSPTYGSPFDMMKTFGISYRAAGENIAMGQATPDEVVTAWMNSEGHRANILNSAYTQIGVGYVADGHYWTQEFIG